MSQIQVASVLSCLFSKVFLAVCVLLASCLAAPLRGDVIILAESVTALPGSTGNALDITLKNTGPEIIVGAFSFEISTTSPGINFTSATINSSAPYVFYGHSTFAADLTTLTGPTLRASDLYDIVWSETGVVSSGTIVASNQTVGLGRVFFDVVGSVFSGDPSPVDIPVTFSSYSFTSLSDNQFPSNDIPFTTHDGMIRISSTPFNIRGGSLTAVPEPTSMGLLAAAFWGYVGIRRGRKVLRVFQCVAVTRASVKA